MSTAAGALTWLLHLLGESARENFQRVEVEAEGLAPGSGGLIFIPTLVGERAPGWDHTARGALVGLQLSHRQGHLVRALYEGTSFAVRSMVEVLRRSGIPVREVTVVGGGASSRLWRAIRAAILEMPLLVTEQAEASMLGAAITAAVGIGLYPEYPAAVRSAVRKKVDPHVDAAMSARYRELHELYKALVEDLRPHFRKLKGLVPESPSGASGGR